MRQVRTLRSASGPPSWCPGWMTALFSSSWDLPDSCQSLKPVLLSSLSTEDCVIIRLSKGSTGVHVATHRCGSTLATTFCLEPCMGSGLWGILLPTRRSHLLFWPQRGNSRAACGLPSSPDTDGSFPASTVLLCLLLHTLSIPTSRLSTP